MTIFDLEKQKYIIGLIIGAILLLIISPKLFFTILIIILIIFYKPILNLIIKKLPMDNQTIDYANIIGNKAKLVTKIVIGLVALIIVLIILVRLIIIVPAGTTGIYHLFGRVKDQPYKSGLHLVIPFAKIDLMSIRTEQYTMSIIPSEGELNRDDSIDALTKEGLKVNLDITVLYHLNEDKAPEVFRTIGLDYNAKIIRTEVRGAIRDVIATYDAKDIYS